MRFQLPKIYPITDTRLSGLSHAEQTALLIDGGATLIQLREKHATPNEFYIDAINAVKIAHARDAKIMINDRVDIAMAVKANGVHLGQTDLSPVEARKLLGPDALIGFSTHNVEQAREALSLPIDHIAIGPIFATSTKSDTDPVVGLDGITAVRQIIGEFPLVAIGGINSTNVSAIINAGADSAATIGSLLSGDRNITENMREIVQFANAMSKNV